MLSDYTLEELEEELNSRRNDVIIDAITGKYGDFTHWFVDCGGTELYTEYAVVLEFDHEVKGGYEKGNGIWGYHIFGYTQRVSSLDEYLRKVASYLPEQKAKYPTSDMNYIKKALEK